MTLDEIIEYMLSSVPEEYDISVGSFFYDLLYPVAEQIYLLQKRISRLSENTFAVTAEGEYLDRKTAEQNIVRKTATYSKGTLLISGNRGEVILKGAKVAADNVLFEVNETVSITENGSVEVGATCTVSGSAGNVKKGDINRFPIKVIPLWNGAGTVKVVIVDADNRPADSELISKVKEHIEENRPIGAEVTVVSASPVMINISVSLTADNTSNIQTTVENVLKDYLSGEAIKKEYISYAKIGSLILSISGVEDYTDLKVNSGTENIKIADGAVPVLESVVLK